MKLPALILIGCVALAQEAIGVGQRVSGELDGAKARAFVTSFASGDYISATQRGKVDVRIRQSHGTLVRHYRSSESGNRRQISFVAEGSGEYRIELVNPSEARTGYEFVITEVTSLDVRLTAAMADKFASPTIEKLRKHMPAETKAFWQELVRRGGSPIVEPDEQDQRYQLVTFLWKHTPTTRNVVVLGPNWGSEVPSENTMRRLMSSDVWYLTKRLPRGARFAYRLSLNDPLRSGAEASAIRRATVQADPLNPNRWNCKQDAPRHECYSSVELPGAAPQPWIVKRSETPAGAIETVEINSAIQQLNREISIYVPADYTRTGPACDLVVLFDGAEYLSAETALPTTLDNLIAARKLRLTVAVLISNVGDRRVKDLVPNPEFSDFVAKELLPWVRSRYHVTSDPARTVIGGFSAGGLASAYVALRHPNVFGKVLSQSGAFWWAPDHFQNADSSTETNWMVKQYLASPKLPLTFYLEAGTFEMDSSGEGGDILEATRHLRDVLLAKGYKVHYQQFAGGHDGLSWRGTLADGLVALLGIN